MNRPDQPAKPGPENRPAGRQQHQAHQKQMTTTRRVGQNTKQAGIGQQ
jgi:hypothetical protein